MLSHCRAPARRLVRSSALASPAASPPQSHAAVTHRGSADGTPPFCRLHSRPSEGRHIRECVRVHLQPAQTDTASATTAQFSTEAAFYEPRFHHHQVKNIFSTPATAKHRHARHVQRETGAPCASVCPDCTPGLTTDPSHTDTRPCRSRLKTREGSPERPTGGAYPGTRSRRTQRACPGCVFREWAGSAEKGGESE